jgi:hypothetical protein
MAVLLFGLHFEPRIITKITLQMQPQWTSADDCHTARLLLAVTWPQPQVNQLCNLWPSLKALVKLWRGHFLAAFSPEGKGSVVVDCCFCSVVCSDPPFACFFCVLSSSSQFKVKCVLTGGSCSCCGATLVKVWRGSCNSILNRRYAKWWLVVVFALSCVLTLPLPALFVLSFLLSLRTTVSLWWLSQLL